MKPDNKTSERLEDFSCECKNILLEDLETNLRRIDYPEICSSLCWPVSQIRVLNPDLRRSLTGNGNVYAIWTQEPQSSEWNPKYVGQTKSDDLGDRMYAHLINRGENTGSKLDDVKSAVSEGKKIAISYIMVCPESLRHFVEERIIATDDRLTWNWRNPGRR